MYNARIYPFMCRFFLVQIIHFLLYADASILELYLLVCMHRLEVKEQNSYNFASIMKGELEMMTFLHITLNTLAFSWVSCLPTEYRAIQDAYKSSDHRGENACLRVDYLDK